jgi:hypothetical protein
MINLNTIKLIANVFVGYSVNRVVRAVIDNNTDPQTRREKYSVNTGSRVLGAMAAIGSKDYVDAKIDSWYKTWIGTIEVEKKEGE